MIELPEDFRDLLIALSDSGAEFVVAAEGFGSDPSPPVLPSRPSLYY
jgi:hypothetical protein